MVNRGRPNLVHCSYHKCLTGYFGRVFHLMYNRILPGRGGYQHFNSLLPEFYEGAIEGRVVSVNNHAIDLERFDPGVRITRFIRDPRDLVVSGYFYHLKGAEPWCNIVNPTKEDFRIVNGCRPEGMPEGHSFSSYLKSLERKMGLRAETEFRRHHFESMRLWPDGDDRILLQEYEDVIGNEVEAFRAIFAHYGLGPVERRVGLRLADRLSARKRADHSHIRDPKAGQWTDYFEDDISQFFRDRYGDILRAHGYEH